MTGSGGSKSFISHLECSHCGEQHDHRVVQTVCLKCGKALMARYDLRSATGAMSRNDFGDRVRSLWRYRELLPLVHDENIVSLGEGLTPIIRLRKLGGMMGFSDLRLKDESFNATGSFKARGLSVAVSKALELDVKEVCIPTAGNAGGALAAYGAAANLVSHIYMPDDTPRINIDECRLYGADVHLVPGVISDCAKAMNVESGGKPWFDMSTLKEPYRLEGKKTMGYEIAEQYGWHLPDAIIYPTGGGTGLIGMWKAFAEMKELGWIDGQLPRMISVQSSGCAPIVKAFDERATVSTFWQGAATCASGLRVPRAFADTLILKTLYDSNGCAIAVNDETIVETMRKTAMVEGLLLSPEGAAAIGALDTLLKRNLVTSSSSILVYNTGSGLKYGEVLRAAASPNKDIDSSSTVQYIKGTR